MTALCRLCAFMLSSGLFALSPLAVAESRTAKDSVEREDEKRITLRQTVEPSFHIEPIVHRFEARRGAVIPFKFEIKSTGKAMDVTVFPVKLRQEVTGIILHDAEGQPPSEMQFTSPTEFKLAPGESQSIEGTVTVPLAKSNFLSYGVLVRDNGQTSERETESIDASRTTAAIRFVTQYVLRVDIETGVKDLSEMDHLAFEQGRVVNEQGMPVATTFLVNPTDFAFECGVRGTIESPTNSRPKPFRMMLPSRQNLEGDLRYLVRIMPKSRVMLNAPVDSLLFPGEQSLHLELTNGRRSLVDQSFAVNVSRGAFPALETQLAYLDNELSVQPAQIEVGTIAGAKRTCNLRFTNNSMGIKSVRMELRDMNGNPLDGLRFSSEEFQVKPARTKTIRAAIESTSELSAASYGLIQLRVSSEGGREDIQTIPLAMLFGEPPAPNVQVGELQAVETNGYTSFSLDVTNAGQAHVPIHAQLQVADGSRRALELADGFGRWLRPGETRELSFKPQQMLKAGDYQVSLNLQTTPDQDPLTQTLIIKLAPGTP